MAIEFRCVNCNKLLRVKDEAAGKKAKCPECATVVEIPTPGAAPAEDDYELDVPPAPRIDVGSDRPAINRPPEVSTNPFQSPMAYDMEMSRGEAVAGGEIVPTHIELGAMFSESWRIFKGEMGLVIGSAFLAGVLGNGSQRVAELIGQMTVDNMGFPGIIITVVLVLASLVFGIFLNIGQAILVLKVARGQRAQVSDLFVGGPFILEIILASILFFLLLMLGFALLIIPGVIFVFMFWPYYLLIIDKRVSVFESFSIARQITSGNKLTLFLMYIVSIGIVFLGLLACIVGIFVAVPYLWLVLVVTYLSMSGQPIARPQGH